MRSTTGQSTMPRRIGTERPWALPPGRVAADLGADPVAGLSEAEAAGRLAQFGENVLVEQGRKSSWRLLAEQFANTMIVVLLVAAVVAAALGDLKDTVVILAILVLNGLLGFVQEYRAEQAMAALKAMTAPVVRVRRGGRVRELPAAEVVPGDLVLLGPGDLLAVDLRLTESWALRINEAALTGESEPVTKQVEPLPEIDESMLADRRNMAFRGTAVTGGRGAGVVVATGMATELGRLAELLQRHPAEPTPLQRRLAVLGRWMAAAALVVCAVVFAVGVARGEPVERMFLTAVSLAVAAIPEGLPAVVTIALALGARRMAARHALVRKLPAVETLGSTTVICSDKTGTLTQNRMQVERVWTPAGSYRVTGDGYAPVGTVVPDTAQGGPTHDAQLDRLARVAAACNDASLRPPTEAGGPWSETGDPTEAALLALAGKLGVDRDTLERDRPRVAEVAFDATRRRMTTLHRRPDGLWAAVKGAVDALVPLLDPADAALAEQARVVAGRWASDGYRILALAERQLPAAPDPPELAEAGLRLLGLAAMADPPRAESAAAVAACRRAGVTPVMITGDDARTAGVIAGRVGILDGGGVLTGAELARLDEEGLAERVAGTRVFARTSPEQKLRLVGAWKQQGAVVAMTGDGVNDAPALRQADIGVAMGVTGTDVSKEAADMILADDNFATIVAAIGEGRRIYDNIRRFVRYLLTTNSGEIWVMFLASVLALPVPLLPVQILWVNLVTDGLPAIALGLEPVERDAMRRPPRSPTESIFARGLWQHALWVGLTMAAVCLALLVGARAASWPWQSMVFTTLALLQLGHALAVRSERESFFSLGAWSNPLLLVAVVGAVAVQLAILYLPALQRLFDTQALGPVQLAVVLVASTAAFFAVEIEKWIIRRRS